jgi:lipoate-protein ligase B
MQSISELSGTGSESAAVRPEVKVFRLGISEYGTAWDLQKELVRLRTEGRHSDALLLTEPKHVYTLGKASDDDHLLAGSEELRTHGTSVYAVDRGGDVTYHGPGQLVGYPIFDLHHHYLDLHRYLRDIEEVLIRTLTDFDIAGGRDPDYTGVWVGGEKIAAIGVKVTRWVTMHGFALNVSTELKYFDRIIPCGIFHRGVTSMEKVTGVRPDMDDVVSSLLGHVRDVFAIEMVDTSLDFLPPEYRTLFNSDEHAIK